MCSTSHRQLPLLRMHNWHDNFICTECHCWCTSSTHNKHNKHTKKVSINSSTTWPPIKMQSHDTEHQTWSSMSTHMHLILLPQKPAQQGWWLFLHGQPAKTWSTNSTQRCHSCHTHNSQTCCRVYSRGRTRSIISQCPTSQDHPSRLTGNGSPTASYTNPHLRHYCCRNCQQHYQTSTLQIHGNEILLAPILCSKRNVHLHLYCRAREPN